MEALRTSYSERRADHIQPPDPKPDASQSFERSAARRKPTPTAGILRGTLHKGGRDTIERFEAIAPPVITDGEQRKYHNFWLLGRRAEVRP
jgi:hypothetical protein